MIHQETSFDAMVRKRNEIHALDATRETADIERAMLKIYTARSKLKGRVTY